jgi:hypothetical protein
MPGRLKSILIGGGAVFAVASPLAFTLGSADLGGVVSSSIIAAMAVATLVVSIWPGRGDAGSAGSNADVSGDSVAVRTGQAHATSGGDANTGVRRRRGTAGNWRAERTGSAVARGEGSHANSGVEDVD